MEVKISEKVHNSQIDLFDRVIQNASPKVKEANDRVVARINQEEEVRRLAREYEERRKLNEHEENEEREIWYEILDNEVMAIELAGIADSWFLKWALAVYKDEIDSDAISEAYTEYQCFVEEDPDEEDKMEEGIFK